MSKGSKGLFLYKDNSYFVCPSKDCMSSTTLAVSDVAVELTAWFVITFKFTSLVYFGILGFHAHIAQL